MVSDERDDFDELESLDDGGSVVLSDLLNLVFDKGVVISGSVVIGIANIDLVRLGLDLVISSAETELRRGRRPERVIDGRDADVPVLPPGRVE